jgi:hypothetical protein
MFVSNSIVHTRLICVITVWISLMFCATFALNFCSHDMCLVKWRQKSYALVSIIVTLACSLFNHKYWTLMGPSIVYCLQYSYKCNWKRCVLKLVHTLLLLSYETGKLLKITELNIHITHKTAVCCNPHSSSKWDSHIGRRLGCVHKKMSSYICENITLNIGLLRVGTASVSYKTEYLWVRINCCFMNDIWVGVWLCKYLAVCLACLWRSEPYHSLI